MTRVRIYYYLDLKRNSMSKFYFSLNNLWKNDLLKEHKKLH